MMFKSLQNYFSRQIQEIESDKVLRIYSYFLILCHFWTVLFWQKQEIEKILVSSTETFCWPFFPRCEIAKSFVEPFASFLLPLYFLLILLALSRKQTAQRWLMLLVLEFYKFSIQALDYAFMGNYHFMPHIVTMVFLFVPYKRDWIRFWLISFYLAAASLKLNFEWLSGGSLSWKVPFGSLFVLQLGAFFVLMMEAVLPWFFLSAKRGVRIFAFLIFSIFHVVSYFWVGFFYPAVMFSLIAFWYLELSEEHQFEFSLKRKEKGFLVGFFFWLIFIVFQLLAFSQPREAALGGRSRLFSLNMFDARSQCFGFFLIRHGSEIVEVNFKNDGLGVRVKCDPIVFLEQARLLCQTRKSLEDPIEAHLVSRQTTDIDLVVLVKEQNVCQK